MIALLIVAGIWFAFWLIGELSEQLNAAPTKAVLTLEYLDIRGSVCPHRFGLRKNLDI